jgi:leucyl-tRNA synthetase
MAEELWHALGHTKSLAHEPWPQPDPALLVEDTFQLVIQVNGKRRGEIEVPEAATKEELERIAREDEAVQRHLPEGKAVKRVIVVPGRLVNFVV